LTRRGLGAIGLLAWLAVSTSLAIGLGTPPVRAEPLPLPSPLPSIGLPSPLPSIGLPSPLPSIDLSPLPSIDLSPLPSIGLGTPLPTLSLGLSPSPAPSTATSSSAAPSERPDASASNTPEPDASGAPGAGGGGPVSAGADATRGQISVPEAPPLAPSLPDLGSWLVPTLGVAVPAAVVAVLVALQLIGGAAALRVVRGSLDRIGSHVPSWLRSNERLPGGRRN
jgi:hypothetical protein